MNWSAGPGDGRTLAYWLSPQLASANSESLSALRLLADNFGQRRGTLRTLSLLAIGFVGAACVALLSGFGSAALGCVVLAAPFGLGALGVRAMLRRRLTDLRPVPVSRAPRSVAQAWMLWGLAAVVVGGFAAVVLATQGGTFSGGSALTAFWGLGALLGFVAVLLFAPASSIEHARRDFRALIERDPDLRGRLETMAGSYEDPGFRPFGPL